MSQNDEVRLTPAGELVAIKIASKKRVDAFNQGCPEGSRVRYYPVVGRAEFIETKLSRYASVLDLAEAIVCIAWVECVVGWVLLDQVEVVKP